MFRFSPARRQWIAAVPVFCTLALALVLPRECAAQALGGPGSMNGSASQARRATEDRAFARQQQKNARQRSLYGGIALTDQPLVEVRVEGNTTIPAHAILSRVDTQAGRPAYEAQVSKDVRSLYETRWFRSVSPVIKQDDRGPILVFEVREKPIVGKVEFRGNKKIKTAKLIAECGLTENRSPYDPIANRKCVERIEKLYEDKGYREVKVQLVSGSNEGERDVIFEIAEGPKIVVDGFNFAGNKAISTAVLKTRLETKRRYVWLIGGIFDPETLAGDEASLEQYYHNLGYFDAKVTATAMRRQGSGSLYIRYDISEGQLYYVDKIRFEGNTLFADGDLRGQLELGTGSRFLERTLRKDIDALKNKYDELGRPFAQVQFRREFGQDPGMVDLVYSFDEDRVRYIGRINVNIRGDDPHTSEFVVHNQVARNLTPGELAKAKDIKLAIDRLRGSQLWDRAEPPAVNVRPVDGGLYVSPEVMRGQDATVAQAPVQTTGAAASSLPVGHSMLRPTFVAGTQAGVEDEGDALLQEIRAELEQSTEGFYEWLRQPEAPEFQPIQDAELFRDALEPASEESDEVVVGESVIRGQSFEPAFAAPDGTFRSQSIDRLGQPVPQSFIPGGSPQGDPFGGTLSGQPPGFVDIDIDVTEARTGRFMFGAGVNSDAGVVGQIVLEENNFDLFRPPRSFADFRNGRAWRGGGQSFRLEASPGAEVSRYLVSWQDPYFMNTDFSLGVSGFWYTRFFEDWTEERLGGRVTVGRTLNQFWSVSTAVRLERVLVRDVIDVAGINEAPQVLRDASGSNFLSTGRFNIAYDTRDSSFMPTKGFLGEFGYEQAFGDYVYPRFDLGASQYWTLYERPDGYGKHTLRLSGDLGFLGDNAPVFERYYAGGFQTLRGFEFRGVSPETTGAGATATARRTGGTFQWVNTLEYMVPLTANDNFKGVLFTDFGTVSENVSLDEFRVSTGFGFRINVPAMGPAPLAFDFAFPIVKETIDDERIFSFYIGLTR